MVVQQWTVDIHCNVSTETWLATISIHKQDLASAFEKKTSLKKIIHIQKKQKLESEFPGMRVLLGSSSQAYNLFSTPKNCKPADLNVLLH